MIGAKLDTESVLFIGDSIIAVAREINLIYKVNIKTRELKIVGTIPEESKYTDRLCSKVIAYKDRYIFIPLNAKKIWFCDKEFQEWEGISMPKSEYENLSLKFSNAFIYKEVLIMIGHFFPGIMYINLLDNSTRALLEPYKELMRYQEKIKDCFTMFRYQRIDNLLYIVSSVSNHVIKWDLDKDSYESFCVGSEENRYSGILWDGNCFWLSPRMNTSIVRWDKDICKEISMPQELQEIKHYFIGIEQQGKKIILPGCELGKTVVLSDSGIEAVSDKQYMQYIKDELGNRIMFSSSGKGKIVDKNGFQFDFDSKINENIWHEYILDGDRLDNFDLKGCRESELFDLTFYIWNLQGNHKKIKFMDKRRIGKIIYEYLCNKPK